MFRKKLLRRPVQDLSNLYRQVARIHASHLCEHLTVAVALDELHGNVEVQQARQRFTRQRARKHVAPDYDMIYSGLTNLLQHCLERGEIAMNVIECSDSHGTNALSLPLPRRFGRLK